MRQTAVGLSSTETAIVRLSGPIRTVLSVGLLLAGAPSFVDAAVRLEISGVSGRLESNVRAHVGPPPTERAGARGYQRRARIEADRALQALGYYNAEIEADRQPRGDDVVVRLRITPGPQVTLGQVEIVFSGDARDDPMFLQLRNALPLKTGQGLHHGEYENAKLAIQSLALQRGYFDGRFTVQRVEVDLVEHTAHVMLRYDSGTRYRLGRVVFSETPFTEDLLQRLVPFEPGEPYTAELVGELNRNLLDSRYFETVQVRPLQNEAEDHLIPVEVELTERTPNQIGVGAGASTDTGPRIRLTWDRFWVNRYGHKFSADLELAEIRQGLSTRYTVPLEDAVDDLLDFQFGFRLEEFPDSTSERFAAAVQRQQNLDSGWRRTTFFRWERIQQGDVRGTTQFFLPGVSYVRTRSRGGVDPSWGDRQLYSVETTHETLGSDLTLSRARTSHRWLRPFADRHRLLLRGDLGWLETSQFERVPDTLRFFAGGDQSVRGFPYNSLGPGRYLATGSVEYGYHFRQNWRAALFADAGNAFMKADEKPDIKVGTGFGIHWISPVGPVRVDFAWGVSEEEVPFRVHFSLGAQL